MECQSGAGLGAAPAGVAAAVMSASPPEVSWPGSLVMPDPREVGSLSREGMSSVGGLTLYPLDYRAALACSLVLCPLPHRLPLRVAFPGGGGQRVYHVPRVKQSGSFRLRLYAGDARSACA